MTEVERTAARGRLADVSAAVLAGDGSDRAQALASRLRRWLQDVQVVAGGGALRRVEAALRAASCERVLLVSAEREPPAPELLLALVAWPAGDAVVAPDAGAERVCGVFRRDTALAAAADRLAAGDRALAGWLDTLAAAALPADVLESLNGRG